MIENISTDHLEERKAVVNNDISVVKQRLQGYEATKVQIEQKKLEDIALLNALTGATQQIDLFLKEIYNEEAIVEEAIASDVENSSEED